jgi:putative membrane protein
LIKNIFEGILIGIALVLPGLSAGTIILILGFYRRFIDDLAAFTIRPYYLHLAGAVLGALATVYTVSYLFQNHNQLITGFILGLIIASVPAVLGAQSLDSFRPLPLLLGALGFYVSWFIVCSPIRSFTVLPPGGLFHFFLGGTLASATMLLPGVSGSAVLVIVNLYDDVIYAVSHWQWLKMAFLSAGFLVGLFGLARLLSALYRRYQVEVSFLLAGLITGSTRALLPVKISLLFFILAGFGAVAVLLLTRMHRKPEP